MIEVAVPGLVNLIESNAKISPNGEIRLRINSHTNGSIKKLLHSKLSLFAPELTGQALPAVLILGCTHFPLVREYIEQVWQELYGTTIMLIDPGVVAATKFGEYLLKHREFTLSAGAMVRLI